MTFLRDLFKLVRFLKKNTYLKTKLWPFWYFMIMLKLNWNSMPYLTHSELYSLVVPIIMLFKQLRRQVIYYPSLKVSGMLINWDNVSRNNLIMADSYEITCTKILCEESVGYGFMVANFQLHRLKNSIQKWMNIYYKIYQQNLLNTKISQAPVFIIGFA